MHDRVFDQEFAQRYLMMQRRDDLDPDGEFVCMQQRRLVRAFRAAKCNVVRLAVRVPRLKSNLPTVVRPPVAESACSAILLSVYFSKDVLFR